MDYYPPGCFSAMIVDVEFNCKNNHVWKGVMWYELGFLNFSAEQEDSYRYCPECGADYKEVGEV